MSAQPSWPQNWPGLGWIVAFVALVLAILLPFLGRLDLAVALVVAAIASHRL